MAGGPLRGEGNKAQIFPAPYLKAAPGADHTSQARLHPKGRVVDEVMAGKYIQLAAFHTKPVCDVLLDDLPPGHDQAEREDILFLEPLPLFDGDGKPLN